MSTKGERYNAARVAPTQSTTPGLGVTRLATSTTAANYDLDSFKHMFGKLLVFQNESTTAGDAIYITFAPDDGTAVSAAQAAGTTIANSTVKANGYKLLPGDEVVWVLNKGEHRYMHVDALANTPTLCIYPVGRGTSRI